MIFLGIIIFVGFTYLTTNAHEYGHALVCAMSGYNWKVNYVPPLFETRSAFCFGQPENYLLYWSVGGIMGTVAAGVPFAVLRKYKFIIIGTVPHIIANAITGSMETLVHSWYINTPDIPYAIASIPMLAAVTGLILKYSFTKIDSPISQPTP